ncbi:hypothetical protein ANCCEY_15533, partial [Ancylostoma ceylanicum]
MIKNLLTFSLKNRWLVVTLSFILMVVGYYCFTHLKIEAYPDIADTNVIVVAQYPGRAAEEVEQQDWVIKPYLLQTDGIADIATFGGPLKQYHILAYPDKLRKYELTVSDVERAIVDNNQNTGGNIIERGGQGFSVRGLGTIKDETDIENVVLKSVNGVPVFVRDVASVEITPPPPSGVLGYTVSDENVHVNNGVEGIVLLRRYENPSEVLIELKQRIADLQEHELPEGVTIRTL